jgi:hypothetical protein
VGETGLKERKSKNEDFLYFDSYFTKLAR